MGHNPKNKLIIAVSSRTLFDLDESNQIFEERGLAEYTNFQIEHEDDQLNPGVAFPLIKGYSISDILIRRKVI